MVSIGTQFADSTSGIGAFNINLKSFLFQLLTFLIVLLIFKRWILPPINKTIEARRKTLEESLQNARKAQEDLEKAEARVEEMVKKGRADADDVIKNAQAEYKSIVAKAESAAEAQAQRVIADAKDQISQEHNKLREELKGELTNLVVLTTQKVLRTKLDSKQDAKLVEQSIKEIN